MNIDSSKKSKALRQIIQMLREAEDTNREDHSTVEIVTHDSSHNVAVQSASNKANIEETSRANDEESISAELIQELLKEDEKQETPSQSDYGKWRYPPTVHGAFNALVDACQEGDLERVQDELWQRPWLPHISNDCAPDSGNNPLLHAVHWAREDIVRFLCQKGCSPTSLGTVHPRPQDDCSTSELEKITCRELCDLLLGKFQVQGSRGLLKLMKKIKEILKAHEESSHPEGLFEGSQHGTSTMNAIHAWDSTLIPPLCKSISYALVEKKKTRLGNLVGNILNHRQQSTNCQRETQSSSSVKHRRKLVQPTSIRNPHHPLAKTPILEGLVARHDEKHASKHQRRKRDRTQQNDDSEKENQPAHKHRKSLHKTGPYKKKKDRKSSSSHKSEFQLWNYKELSSDGSDEDSASSNLSSLDTASDTSDVDEDRVRELSSFGTNVQVKRHKPRSRSREMSWGANQVESEFAGQRKHFFANGHRPRLKGGKRTHEPPARQRLMPIRRAYQRHRSKSANDGAKNRGGTESVRSALRREMKRFTRPRSKPLLHVRLNGGNFNTELSMIDEIGQNDTDCYYYSSFSNVNTPLHHDSNSNWLEPIKEPQVTEAPGLHTDNSMTSNAASDIVCVADLSYWFNFVRPFPFRRYNLPNLVSVSDKLYCTHWGFANNSTVHTVVKQFLIGSSSCGTEYLWSSTKIESALSSWREALHELGSVGWALRDLENMLSRSYLRSDVSYEAPFFYEDVRHSVHIPRRDAWKQCSGSNLIQCAMLLHCYSNCLFSFVWKCLANEQSGSEATEAILMEILEWVKTLISHHRCQVSKHMLPMSAISIRSDADLSEVHNTIPRSWTLWFTSSLWYHAITWMVQLVSSCQEPDTLSPLVHQCFQNCLLYCLHTKHHFPTAFAYTGDGRGEVLSPCLALLEQVLKSHQKVSERSARLQSMDNLVAEILNNTKQQYERMLQAKKDISCDATLTWKSPFDQFNQREATLTGCIEASLPFNMLMLHLEEGWELVACLENISVLQRWRLNHDSDRIELPGTAKVLTGHPANILNPKLHDERDVWGEFASLTCVTYSFDPMFRNPGSWTTDMYPTKADMVRWLTGVNIFSGTWDCSLFSTDEELSALLRTVQPEPTVYHDEERVALLFCENWSRLSMLRNSSTVEDDFLGNILDAIRSSLKLVSTRAGVDYIFSVPVVLSGHDERTDPYEREYIAEIKTLRTNVSTQNSKNIETYSKFLLEMKTLSENNSREYSVRPLMYPRREGEGNRNPSKRLSNVGAIFLAPSALSWFKAHAASKKQDHHHPVKFFCKKAALFSSCSNWRENDVLGNHLLTYICDTCFSHSHSTSIHQFQRGLRRLLRRERGRYGNFYSRLDTLTANDDGGDVKCSPVLYLELLCMLSCMEAATALVTCDHSDSSMEMMTKSVRDSLQMVDLHSSDLHGRSVLLSTLMILSIFMQTLLSSVSENSVKQGTECLSLLTRKLLTVSRLTIVDARSRIYALLRDSRRIRNIARQQSATECPSGKANDMKELVCEYRDRSGIIDGLPAEGAEKLRRHKDRLQLLQANHKERLQLERTVVAKSMMVEQCVLLFPRHCADRIRTEKLENVSELKRSLSWVESSLDVLERFSSELNDHTSTSNNFVSAFSNRGFLLSLFSNDLLAVNKSNYSVARSLGQDIPNESRWVIELQQWTQLCKPENSGHARLQEIDIGFEKGQGSGIEQGCQHLCIQLFGTLFAGTLAFDCQLRSFLTTAAHNAAANSQKGSSETCVDEEDVDDMFASIDFEALEAQRELRKFLEQSFLPLQRLIDRRRLLSNSFVSVKTPPSKSVSTRFARQHSLSLNIGGSLYESLSSKVSTSLAALMTEQVYSNLGRFPVHWPTPVQLFLLGLNDLTSVARYGQGTCLPESAIYQTLNDERSPRVWKFAFSKSVSKVFQSMLLGESSNKEHQTRLSKQIKLVACITDCLRSLLYGLADDIVMKRKSLLDVLRLIGHNGTQNDQQATVDTMRILLCHRVSRSTQKSSLRRLQRVLGTKFPNGRNTLISRFFSEHFRSNANLWFSAIGGMRSSLLLVDALVCTACTRLIFPCAIGVLFNALFEYSLNGISVDDLPSNLENLISTRCQTVARQLSGDVHTGSSSLESLLLARIDCSLCAHDVSYSGLTLGNEVKKLSDQNFAWLRNFLYVTDGNDELVPKFDAFNGYKIFPEAQITALLCRMVHVDKHHDPNTCFTEDLKDFSLRWSNLSGGLRFSNVWYHLTSLVAVPDGEASNYTRTLITSMTAIMSSLGVSAIAVHILNFLLDVSPDDFKDLPESECIEGILRNSTSSETTDEKQKAFQSLCSDLLNRIRKAIYGVDVTVQNSGHSSEVDTTGVEP